MEQNFHQLPVASPWESPIFWLWALLLLGKYTMQNTSLLHPLHLIIWPAFVCPVSVMDITLYWLSKWTFLAMESSRMKISTVRVPPPVLLAAVSRGVNWWALPCLCTAQTGPCSVMVFSDIHSGEICCKTTEWTAEATMWSHVWMSRGKAVCLSVCPHLREVVHAEGHSPVASRWPGLFPLSSSNVPPGAVNCARHRTLTP